MLYKCFVFTGVGLPVFSTTKPSVGLSVRPCSAKMFSPFCSSASLISLTMSVSADVWLWALAVSIAVSRNWIVISAYTLPFLYQSHQNYDKLGTLEYNTNNLLINNIIAYIHSHSYINHTNAMTQRTSI